MVCAAAEAAKRIDQLLNGVAALTVINSARACHCRHAADYYVFYALLAVAAAQESLDCHSAWQHRGAFLHCCTAEIKVVAAKRTALRQSLTAAVRQAALAQPAHAAVLRALLLHFASRQRSKSALSTVLTLLCRVSSCVREAVASCLSSHDLDSLLSRLHDCSDDVEMFVAKYNNINMTETQTSVFLETMLQKQPSLYSLRAAAALLTNGKVPDKLLRNVAAWAVRAPQDLASEAVEVLYAVAAHRVVLPTDQLGRLAAFLPQSSRLFSIYCAAALAGDYGGLDYLESAAQLDQRLIVKHADLLIRLGANALDASLRVCKRPGYRSLWRHVLSMAYPKHRRQKCMLDPKVMRQLEPHRPVLEQLRQDFVDMVVLKCDYSNEDLVVLSQIIEGEFPKIGDSEVCRADLLKALKDAYGFIKINLIHTPCEMAVAMQPRLEFDLRKCTLQHSVKCHVYSSMAISILRASENQSEVFAVLDAHEDPYDGLQHTKNCLQAAALHFFYTDPTITTLSYRLRQIYDALGPVQITDLQDPDLSRSKQVAVACMLALNHGPAPVLPVPSRPEQLSSPVIDYALALGGSLSDIHRLYRPLGALAPIALCATNMFSGDSDDALFIARDPRSRALVKYHIGVFRQVALCIAQNAVLLVKAGVSLTEIAWILAYLPRK